MNRNAVVGLALGALVLLAVALATCSAVTTKTASFDGYDTYHTAPTNKWDTGIEYTGYAFVTLNDGTRLRVRCDVQQVPRDSRVVLKRAAAEWYISRVK